MQPSHPRLICRAHNRFTPSIVLWQHFVLPNRPLLQQPRLSSSATASARDHSSENGQLVTSQKASEPEHFEAATAKSGREDVKPVSKVRKLTTVKSTWYPRKGEASITKAVQSQYESRQASLTKPEQLLATARAAFENAEEYEGVVVKPMESRESVKENSLPWCLEQGEMTMSGFDRLAIEIDRFHAYAKPSKFESIARRHVIEQVRKHVLAEFPKHVLEVFGSEKTGIALATSDIDFRFIRGSELVNPVNAKLPPMPTLRSQALAELRKLYWSKLRSHKAYLLPALRHARYPLISLQDRQSGLDLQIVLANDTSISRVIMQDYMEQYPYLRQLYSVVKTMFDVRGLSDVFRGGFGSYSLFMMVVASIRHNPHARNDAAGALINFLKFWRDFDTRKHGISIDPVEVFDKGSPLIMTDTTKAKIKQGTAQRLPPYMLSLRDPADETNDLGRKGIAIKHVQATFRSLVRQLQHDSKINTRPSLLAPLVGSSYMLDKPRRLKLMRYGERLWTQTQKTLSVKAKAMIDTEKMDGRKENENALEEETQKLARAEKN
ncbi:Nn.00g108970.m01.CDS01 [Neocucurbitaria sp. VM-36]